MRYAEDEAEDAEAEDAEPAAEEWRDKIRKRADE